MKNLCENDITSVIKPRHPESHKGDFGKLLILSGCTFYRGAAYLSVSGALRCGAGIVTLASVPDVINACSARIAECTYFPLTESEHGTVSSDNSLSLIRESKKYSAILAGCGMGCDADVKSLIQSLTENASSPLILDADALNALKGNDDILLSTAYPAVITPHIMEFSRLSGISRDEIVKEPQKYAEEFAYTHNCTVILKSHRTVIASPEKETLISDFGNVGLAKGGSGDLLAGMTASFIAQGYEPYDSAKCAVFIHGKAADLCAEEMSVVSMLPSDVVNHIDKVFKNIE